MVHHRLNERQTNPNPHLNFISALPAPSQQDAHQLLCALAAQVRPVMKAHGFSVNSLEEYEYNAVFLGRNWNNGETVELVLRRRDGAFLPTSSLMSTLCHELAHIKHMNHGPAFQALWWELRRDVRNLQNKGYYGDGYWSSGTRLADGEKVAGTGIQPGDLPQYMCGGAHSRSRPVTAVRKRPRAQAGPSLHTGAQTAKKRKAGVRVTRPDAFIGEGVSLNSGEADNTKGTGFRKQAGSKRAREARALAAETRLRASQAQAQDLPGLSSSTSVQDDPASESETESEAVTETDRDRLKALMDSIKDEGLDDLKDEAWDAHDREFAFDIERWKMRSDDSENRKGVTRDNEIPCDLLRTDPSRTTFTSATSSTSLGSAGPSKGKTNHGAYDQSGVSTKKDSSSSLGLGKLVQTEIDFRKKEALGLTPTRLERKLGAGDMKSSRSSKNAGKQRDDDKNHRSQTSSASWSCHVCTLSNSAEHLACSACGTTKGEAIWVDKQLL